jgi:hypothetical protein
VAESEAKENKKPTESNVDFTGIWVDAEKDGFTCFEINEDGKGKTSKKAGNLGYSTTLDWTVDGDTLSFGSTYLGVTSFTKGEGETLVADNGTIFITLEAYKEQNPVELVNKNGETENLSFYELSSIRSGNQLKFDNIYADSPITVTDYVVEVKGKTTVAGEWVDAAVELASGWIVGLTGSQVATASNLDVGDKVTAQGTLAASVTGDMCICNGTVSPVSE